MLFIYYRARRRPELSWLAINIPIKSPNVSRRIKLPKPVAAIYRAVEELEALYPGRKFTPDGHLVGSIGEVVAAQVSIPDQFDR